MPSINLITEKTVEDRSVAKSGGKIAVGAVLTLIALMYGGLIFYGRSLTLKSQVAEEEYRKQFDKFLSKEAGEVVDFKNRSDAASGLLEKRQPADIILGQVESAILPPVYLDSLKYDNEEKTVSLSCVGDNFNTLAKQILSFKESGYFSEVIPGKSVWDSQNNKLTFFINLKINPRTN